MGLCLAAAGREGKVGWDGMEGAQDGIGMEQEVDQGPSRVHGAQLPLHKSGEPGGRWGVAPALAGTGKRRHPPTICTGIYFKRCQRRDRNQAKGERESRGWNGRRHRHGLETPQPREGLAEQEGGDSRSKFPIPNPPRSFRSHDGVGAAQRNVMEGFLWGKAMTQAQLPVPAGAQSIPSRHLSSAQRAARSWEKVSGQISSSNPAAPSPLPPSHQLQVSYSHLNQTIPCSSLGISL